MLSKLYLEEALDTESPPGFATAQQTLPWALYALSDRHGRRNERDQFPAMSNDRRSDLPSVRLAEKVGNGLFNITKSCPCPAKAAFPPRHELPVPPEGPARATALRY
ncbi:hypothetical protein GCM10027040_28760 [Halomonas shantousis]